MLDFKGRIRSWLQFGLKCAGKGDLKVASVFSVNAAASRQAVLHLREGAPDVPVWLFTTVVPLPETAALCERVYRENSAVILVARAERTLWHRSVAISVGTWTGSGAWALKLAPFLIPPFRALILNGHGGFFSGTPSNVLTHAARACWDAIQLAWRRIRESIHAAREAIHDARVHAQEDLHTARVRGRWAIHSARVWTGDLRHGLSKLSEATALRLASTVLRWMSNPHVTLFHRLHGDQPLMLDVEAVTGEDFLHFTQRGPHWNGAELEQAARASEARWILWEDGASIDPVSEAMPLFEDNRTFAASRQAHFRGWKKAVAPTAPFRTLQTGEATRVLAPLSSSILVDRKKLLALGIPRCSMPGTAWLILFWKAAAAGWRSYSIGPSVPPRRSLPEQPEFPIQDTSFVLETLLDPASRRLFPRQENLSRGNICFRTTAFAPALERLKKWDSERFKVLIVSPFLPYPLSHGGSVRIYNLCRELSDRVDFTLIAMREANDVVDYDKLHEVFKEVHIVDKDERPLGDKSLPAQVSSSELSSLRALISRLSEKLLPDLIQFEYTHFAGFRDSAPGVPALLVEHDLTFSLYRQLAEANSNPASWKEYRRWLTFERKWLATYEGVWTVSEEDRRRAIEEGQRAPDRTFAIANGVDLDRFRPCSAPQGTPEVFYVGSFRHLPNIIGFEKLCEEIMPRVWAAAPDTQLRVVAGPEHERYWQQFGRTKNLRALDPRIIVHGFVEDLRPLYDRAWVVAVPLEVSAGTNIKVLEAMACGKAIVSTPIGCAGLGLHDGYDIAVRKDWSEFSDAIGTVITGDRWRASLGGSARRTVENRFSWTAIANHAYESYVAVTASPVRTRKTTRSMIVA
jgi:glycosyltransferase involved in cell wall biosynthesis